MISRESAYVGGVKYFDLEPGEWRRTDAPEPAFGPGAIPFLIMFVLSLLFSPFIMYLVTGSFPYWVRPLLG